MKIAVLGTGMVGQTIAGKLRSLGHEVRMGTRNVENALSKTEPDNFGRLPLREWHKSNSSVTLATFEGAASFAELIINATNGVGSLQALELADNQNLQGNVLLDISNPLDFSKGMPPSLFVSKTDSLGEQINELFRKQKLSRL